MARLLAASNQMYIPVRATQKLKPHAMRVMGLPFMLGMICGGAPVAPRPSPVPNLPCAALPHDHTPVDADSPGMLSAGLNTATASELLPELSATATSSLAVCTRAERWLRSPRADSLLHENHIMRARRGGQRAEAERAEAEACTGSAEASRSQEHAPAGE